MGLIRPGSGVRVPPGAQLVFFGLRARGGGLDVREEAHRPASWPSG